MTIFDTRDTYKPFDYPWAKEYHRLQSQEQHWNPDEIEFSHDLAHFNEKLTDKEQTFTSRLLQFFVQSDTDVASNYINLYLQEFKKPELVMMLLSFANMEATHMSAYARLLEVLSIEDYESFLQYPEMAEKHRYMSSRQRMLMGGVPKASEMITDIAKNSVFGEGLQLFGSFIMLLSFGERGLLPGVRDVVTWSMRDETTHVAGMLKVFNTIKEDYPEVWDDETKRAIYNECRQMVELEDRFVSLLFDLLGGDLPNLTKTQVLKYINWLADHRLTQMGLKPIFHTEHHGIDWLGLYQNEIHDDLFNNTGTGYQHSKFNTEDMWS